MPTFVFSYRVPAGYVPGGQETRDRWMSWFETMGDSVSERGNPVFESAEVGNCGAGTRLGGYSFVTADDLSTAVALAKGSPALDTGGGVEVGTITTLNLDGPSEQG
jgi:hypothetical protein